MAKILVADDNSNIQKMVGLALKDQGIDVVAVGNGEAAVRKICDIQPDLVLADVFMPVRSGYEVCKYVKDDSRFSHIPVILLVGAFDPLDEQEAQRVGADGVLKKPFVPPDPLISMVKSALTRAGVPLGTAPAEKAPAPPVASRSAAELLGSHGTFKTGALAPKPPEPEPEPAEEFPAPPVVPVKIPDLAPAAFGSLLEAPAVEEDLGGFSKTASGPERNWEIHHEEEPVEESHGWRPGLQSDTEEPALASAKDAASDWRDEAFHGSLPASGHHFERWSPTAEKTLIFAESPELEEVPAVGISTIEQKLVESPAPFADDAWASAMAAGIEQKLSQRNDELSETHEEKAREISESLAHETASATKDSIEAAPAIAEQPTEEHAKPVDPIDNWFSVSTTPWDPDGKTASLLASTWNTPVPNETEETQEVAALQAIKTVEAVKEEESPTASPVLPPSPELQDPQPIALEEDSQAHEEQAGAETLEDKGWEHVWEAPIVTDPTSRPADEVGEVAGPVVCEMESAEPEPAMLTDFAQEPEPAPTGSPEGAVLHTESQPNTDELVNRVLAKINPDLLQKVTHEILKPLIEALVKDELNSKKS